ncbi:MAG: DNA polymerase III subunit epsilon [Mesorhizobium sp.]
MREIVFDTETTGLDNRLDRVIEIGAIELMDRFPTGRTFHVYIHPQDREIHPDAQAVHGISLADLAGKPVFAGIADEFEAFIDGAMLVAHNAGFDMGFINAEFARLDRAPVDPGRVVDTLAIARRKHPMGPNSLDALCKRYGVDNSHRTRHGALLDSGLLAEVYLELTGGRQRTFGLDAVEAVNTTGTVDLGGVVLEQRPEPLPSRLTEAERAAHAAMVEKLGEKSAWLKPEFQSPDRPA